MTAQTKRVPRDTLARRVKMVRDELGLTQREAAIRCGLTFGEWQGIEGGAEARGLDKKIRKISDQLGYDRDWLMWGGPLAAEGDGLGEAEAPGLGDVDQAEAATTRQYAAGNAA